MYTGIVETTGRIAESRPAGDGHRVRIETDLANEIEAGESVAVSGVCLTAETVDAGGFSATLSSETVSRTYLAGLEPGARVNLERALRVGDSLSGHVVKGTVDGVTAVLAGEERENEWVYEFAIPDWLDRYVVEKRAIAIDGASLTVASRREDRFAVAIVPETHERTVIPEKGSGDPVHVEADALAKYAQRGIESEHVNGGVDACTSG